MDGIHAESVEEQMISLTRPDRRSTGLSLMRRSLMRRLSVPIRGIEPVIEKLDRIITSPSTGECGHKALAGAVLDGKPMRSSRPPTEGIGALGGITSVHASGMVAAHMRKKNNRLIPRKLVLCLPELDHAKICSAQQFKFAAFQAQL